MHLHLFPLRTAPQAVLRVIVAAGLAAGLAFPSPAHAKDKAWHKVKPEFGAVYVLGDSLSDTGRLFAAVGIPPAPAYWHGRTSNGPLWPEYVSPALGLDYQPLDNFAWVGAETGRGNVWETTLGIDLPGMLDELDEYMGGLGPSHRADKHALYVVFGGSNDFFQILNGADPTPVIHDGVINLATIVGTLQRRGAENIVVVNLPDLGRTPRVLTMDAVVPGTADAVSGLCATFNVGLATALGGLPCDVVYVDAFTALDTWVSDPATYGFTNVTDPGLLSGTDGEGYFYWDDVHPTTQVHALMAGLIVDAIEAASGKNHRLVNCHPHP